MPRHYRRRRANANQPQPPNNGNNLPRRNNDNSEQPPSTSRNRPNARNPVFRVDFQRQLPLGAERRAGSPVFNAGGHQQEGNMRALANRLMFHARENMTIDERALQCLNCGLLPLTPVTGICGHTRCLECIQRHEICPCGQAHSPWQLSVNILAQGLIQKILSTESNFRHWMATSQEGRGHLPRRQDPPVPMHVAGRVLLAEMDINMVPEGGPRQDHNSASLKRDEVSSIPNEGQIPKNKDEEKQTDKASDDTDYVNNASNASAAAKSEEPVKENPVGNDDMREDGAWGPLDFSAPPSIETISPFRRIPVTPAARVQFARHLMDEGQYLEAVPHLARAATADEVAHVARRLLTQALQELSRTRNVVELEADIREEIGSQATSRWLRERDLECVYCYDTLCKPVTTPCGHTFCHACLERSLDYRLTCALCMQTLNNICFRDVQITEYVCAALMAIGAIKASLPPDPSVIPILACTVAFPGMPCPIFLFNPRYWFMIRRILESETRQFGMVAYRREGNYAEYGTILELRDCVYLPDGCTIVSTIGISRFRVIEKDVWDGWCDVVRIQPVVDIPIVNNETVADLRLLARHIAYKAAIWISGINPVLRANIHTAFGPMPYIDAHGNWWKEPDGPSWLWWLISILPLKLEIKILILATDSLVKRMRAVLRTLNTSLAQPRQCVYESALLDWWEQRQL
ncbi:LON peptidase N-terminal domain and RING finger protein 3 isoform X2 [Amyelois transitella]|nr:LON peptidase N-terminal domain and RING finger protein 3 isoform X2 [Amyelois transitella]